MIDPSTMFSDVRVTCKKCGKINDFGSSEALFYADLSTPCAHCGFRFLEHMDRQMRKMMEMGAKDSQWREWVRTGRNDLIKRRLDELVPMPEDT
jgi:DNA-directed RNA polymerase subunit RPC12/RpoP